MTLKKFFLIPLAVSVALFVYFSSHVEKSFTVLARHIQVNGALIEVLVLAIGLQFLGHVIRAYKMRLLLKPIKSSTTKFQFRALSVGYLFDTILPFRLGELIRTRIVAGAENLSFGFVLSLIVIERAVDAAVLGLLGLSLLPLLGFSTRQTMVYCFILLGFTLAVIVAVTLLVRENVRSLRLWYRLTDFFRPSLKHSLRFKAWSVIYGLQKTIIQRRFYGYLGLTCVSWLFYGLSIFIVAQHFLPHVSAQKLAGLATGPYYGVALPAGPANLGVYSKVANTFTAGVNLSADNRLVYNLVSWAVLIISISAAGLLFFLLKTGETIRRPRQLSVTKDALQNKLDRRSDISQELAAFLENYFLGNTLSRIVHRMERQDHFRLLKYFKGGSDAITILALQNGQEIVKKIIPHEFEDRLKAQYDWLKRFDKQKGIVQALSEERTEEYYAIDLACNPDNVLFFDFIHSHTLKQSKVVLDEVWDYLFKYVYPKTRKPACHAQARDAYIEKHIIGCLDTAAAVNEDLLAATRFDELVINGKTYDNLTRIMRKIKRHSRAWRDIATYQENDTVHGDVAMDNILVSEKTGAPLIIDPAPDGNVIVGPVFDFGKGMQSLYCGYEFLFRDEEPVWLRGNHIDYRDHSSARYEALSSYFKEEIAPRYLTESEQRAMLFHAAALHIRRLKHQVYYNPANALKFYAVGVKTMNDFLAQYDQP